MKKFFNEFKEFINRGNVMDLAVAVVMGAAFTAIINAVVADFITPLISLVTLGIDFSSFSFAVGEGENAAIFTYGRLIQASINFLITALVVFLMVKILNSIARKKPQPDSRACPYCDSTIPRTALRCPNCTTVLDASKVPKDLR